MIRVHHIAVVLLSAMTAFATEDTCNHDENAFRCVKIIKNHDADTVTVDIPGVHPILGKNVGVRLLGIDTPEISTKNQCEKKHGLKAKERVAQLLKDARRIDLRNIKRDKYFRVLAEVFVDGQSLSEILIRENYAYPYFGGTKRTDINWCKVSQGQRIPASDQEARK